MCHMTKILYRAAGHSWFLEQIPGMSGNHQFLIGPHDPNCNRIGLWGCDRSIFLIQLGVQMDTEKFQIRTDPGPGGLKSLERGIRKVYHQQLTAIFVAQLNGGRGEASVYFTAIEPGSWDYNLSFRKYLYTESLKKSFTINQARAYIQTSKAYFQPIGFKNTP